MTGPTRCLRCDANWPKGAVVCNCCGMPPASSRARAKKAPAANAPRAVAAKPTPVEKACTRIRSAARGTGVTPPRADRDLVEQLAAALGTPDPDLEAWATALERMAAPTTLEDYGLTLKIPAAWVAGEGFVRARVPKPERVAGELVEQLVELIDQADLAGARKVAEQLAETLAPEDADLVVKRTRKLAQSGDENGGD